MNVASRYIGRVGGRGSRKPTPESKAYHADIKAQEKHVKEALREFRKLWKALDSYGDAAKAEYPGRSKIDIQRRGRMFKKNVKDLPLVATYLNKYIGKLSDHKNAYSWHNAVVDQLKYLHTVPKYTLSKASEEVGKQAFKGFQSIAIAEGQAEVRAVLPEEVRAFLPKNLIVDVDDGGQITRMTDRFENEHNTLAVKIRTQHDLITRYNDIVRKVKKDLASRDEMTKLAALVTAIIMETGIRPGKVGNGQVKVVNGEDIFLESFGAVTLGPSHVKFIKENFAELQFVGKKQGVNTATLSNGDVIKILKEYVGKAIKGGSKFVFVNARGDRFTTNDIKNYFQARVLSGISPTDFRKLKATQMVLQTLYSMQQDLYKRIREFSTKNKADLKVKITNEVISTIQAAYESAQSSLSHGGSEATTTIRSYINPEVILRFLSQGRIEDTLESAILNNTPQLGFNPDVFLQMARTSSVQLSVGDKIGSSLLEVMNDLEDEMDENGVSIPKTANRVVGQQESDAGGQSNENEEEEKTARVTERYCSKKWGV